MKKMTYVHAIENALNNNMTAETIERLNELKTSFEDRAKRAKLYGHKPSKTTQENAAIKAQIVAWMKEFAVEPLTSAEIAEGMGLEVRKVRGLIGRCEDVEAVRINSKLTKWKVKG